MENLANSSTFKLYVPVSQPTLPMNATVVGVGGFLCSGNRLEQRAEYVSGTERSIRRFNNGDQSRLGRVSKLFNRMEWLLRWWQRERLLLRWHREIPLSSTVRSVLLTTSLILIVSISIYPGLRSLGVLLHAVFTGSFVPGYHSVLLINCPNEQAAKEIGRSVMERRLAASINILPRTLTMYYWKGEIQYASEILMLVRTKTSRIQDVIDYVRSIHPYANPEALSFQVGDGSQAYMKWMDDAIPDDA